MFGERKIRSAGEIERQVIVKNSSVHFCLKAEVSLGGLCKFRPHTVCYRGCSTMS